MNTTMAVVSSSLSFTSTSPFHLPRIEVKAAKPPRLSFSVRSQAASNSQNDGRGRRRVWRRRRLTKKDDTLEYRTARVPFLEEQVWKIRKEGKVLSLDVERMLLSEENRFDFVNEVAAEAIQYVEKNQDEYGGKKAILHVLSDRMNDAGIERQEAYREPDPLKPGAYLPDVL